MPRKVKKDFRYLSQAGLAQMSFLAYLITIFTELRGFQYYKNCLPALIYSTKVPNYPSERKKKAPLSRKYFYLGRL